MSKSGLIQAVLTEDSDATIFGTSNILRICPDDNETYTATLFSSKVFDKAGLGHDELVLIALLVGGDYSVRVSRNLYIPSRSHANLCYYQ